MKKLIITLLMLGFISQGAFGSGSDCQKGAKRRCLDHNTYTTIKSSDEILRLNKELKRLCCQETFDKYKDEI